jgi:hypothetical protein
VKSLLEIHRSTKPKSDSRHITELSTLIDDERIGHAAQIEQTVPVGVVARQTRDFESENDSNVPQCYLGGHARKAATICDTGAREAQILVDHTDLLFVPAEAERTLSKRVLALCRFAVVLNLTGTGLAVIPISELPP